MDKMALPAQTPSEDRLSLLYRLTQTFNSTLDLDEVLNRVMDEVILTMHAERGFLMLLDEKGKLSFRVARGMDQKEIDDPQFEVSRSVIEQVVKDKKAILTSDAQMDERFSMRQSILVKGLRAILCVPLMVKEKITGVIYTDNRVQAGIFRDDDLELLSSIASNAAIAIENARLYQVAIEQGRMEREMQMARKVQSGLLPHSIPKHPSWEFSATWIPAREVGGDYYDFISIQDDRLGVLIADVTDKGMPAALFMASTRNIVRSCVDGKKNPKECLTKANQLIASESADRMYVSMFYCCLDLQRFEATYVNAGHNPALFYQKRDKSLTTLDRTGMWLGVDSTSAYAQSVITMEKGDLILLYTDGVTDAMDQFEQDFGMDRLKEVLLMHADAGTDEILQSIMDAIHSFCGDIVPFDDITLVLIKRS